MARQSETLNNIQASVAGLESRETEQRDAIKHATDLVARADRELAGLNSGLALINKRLDKIDYASTNGGTMLERITRLERTLAASTEEVSATLKNMQTSASGRSLLLGDIQGRVTGQGELSEDVVAQIGAIVRSATKEHAASSAWGPSKIGATIGACILVLLGALNTIQTYRTNSKVSQIAQEPAPVIQQSLTPEAVEQIKELIKTEQPSPRQPARKAPRLVKGPRKPGPVSQIAIPAIPEDLVLSR